MTLTKRIIPLAQKLLLSDRKIPSDPESKKLLVELLDEIVRLSDENDMLRAKIENAAYVLQEPVNARRFEG